MSGGTVISSGINADGVQVVWFSNVASYDLDLIGGSISGGSGFGAGIRLQSPAGGTVDIGSAAYSYRRRIGHRARRRRRSVGRRYLQRWRSRVHHCGQGHGQLLLGLGSDMVNITGGTLAGDIVGDTGDTVAFALGTGTFNYDSPYTISGVDSVSLTSGTTRINGTINADAVTVASGAGSTVPARSTRPSPSPTAPARAGQQPRHAHDGHARPQFWFYPRFRAGRGRCRRRPAERSHQRERRSHVGWHVEREHRNGWNVRGWCLSPDQLHRRADG